MPIDISKLPPDETGDSLYSANGVRIVILSDYFVFEISETDYLGAASWRAKTALAVNMNSDDPNQPILDRVIHKLATSLIPSS